MFKATGKILFNKIDRANAVAPNVAKENKYSKFDWFMHVAPITI